MLGPFAIFFPAGLSQHVDQRIAGESEIRHRHPRQQAADGQPYSVSFRAQVVNRQRHRKKTDQNIQSLGNEGGGSSDARSAIPLAAATSLSFRQQRRYLPDPGNRLQAAGTGFWCRQKILAFSGVEVAIVAERDVQGRG